MRKTYDKEFKVKVAKDIINELTTVGQVSKDNQSSLFECFKTIRLKRSLLMIE